MSELDGEAYDNLLRELTTTNTQLINNAANNLEFNSIEQLEQGSGTLYSITSNLASGGDMAKTLDMKGRESAVKLIEVSKPEAKTQETFCFLTNSCSLLIVPIITQTQ